MLFVIRKGPLVICTALALALSISPLLAQTARVEGTVRTLSGEPVARATIQLVKVCHRVLRKIVYGCYKEPAYKPVSRQAGLI